MIWGRVWFSARSDLEAAQTAEAQGDIATAISSYQHAMRWYSPFASAPVEAADALDRIAADAEKRGERHIALPALRRLRGGILAVRSVYSPFEDRLADINSRLAVQTADEQIALGHQITIRGRDRAQLIADHAALLALDPTPTPGWALWVVLSFFGWIAAVAYTIRFGFTKTLAVNKRPLFRGLAATVLCFSLWVVGLVYA